MNEASEQLKKGNKEFKHRCVMRAFGMPDDALGRHLQNQLIRSLTSSGVAKDNAAILVQRKATFRTKIRSGIEVQDETLIGLGICKDEALFSVKKKRLILKEARELNALFYATGKTMARS